MIRKNARKTVVRVSSKGQFTVPAAIRKSAGIKKGDFLKAYTIGDKLILLEKTSVSPFEEIVERFSRLAAERSLSEEELLELIKDARRELTRQVYGGQAPGCHRHKRPPLRPLLARVATPTPPSWPLSSWPVPTISLREIKICFP